MICPLNRRIYRVLTVCIVVYLLINLNSWIRAGMNFQMLFLGNFSSRIKARVSKNESQTCVIPSLDSFRSSLVHVMSEIKNMSCAEKFPLLFNSTLNSTLIPVLSEAEYKSRGIESCYYTYFESKDGADKAIRKFGKRYPISLEKETNIKPDIEFITIECKQKKVDEFDMSMDVFMGKDEHKPQLADMFAFVPFKAWIKEKVSNAPPQSRKRLSVAIFGIDSVSRANFVRKMPQSYAYIMDAMGAIEMEGYNKIGEGTFSSLMPLLTSKSSENILKSCAVKPRWWFDSCPFIWKNFARGGYVTSYAEDAGKIDIFTSIGRGFRNKPTDYYFGPFSLVAEQNFGAKQSDVCQGPRLFFQTMLDYFKKMMHTMTMNNKAFFHFSWTSTLTHDAINSPALGDKYLKETLQWFRTEGNLEHTILILMSDHGLRWGSVKEADTIQGQLEDRLPFMYFILPKWFKQTYPRAYENLKENSKRLITAHDLHFFLLDVLDISSIEDSTLRERGISLQTAFENAPKSVIPLGISLFLPIPSTRTCRHTLIEKNYCVCNKFSRVPDARTTPMINTAALFVVNEINLQLTKFSSCRPLSLSSVVEAQQRINEDGEVAFLINFKTMPGLGAFEALVVRGPSSWKLEGSVSRVNKYGNQSTCVNDKNVKHFCYCKPRPKQFQLSRTKN